nr:MAG TPA: hypothetical protein [Caudoviricetes sp.]
MCKLLLSMCLRMISLTTASSCTFICSISASV